MMLPEVNRMVQATLAESQVYQSLALVTQA